MEDLKKQEAEIVNSLKSQGTGTYEGTEHYAVVSEVTLTSQHPFNSDLWVTAKRLQHDWCCRMPRHGHLF